MESLLFSTPTFIYNLGLWGIFFVFLGLLPDLCVTFFFLTCFFTAFLAGCSVGSVIYIYIYMCGITQTTQHSGWSLPEVLRLFSGHFMIMCFGHTVFEVHQLIFGCYIICGHRDVI